MPVSRIFQAAFRTRQSWLLLVGSATLCFLASELMAQTDQWSHFLGNYDCLIYKTIELSRANRFQPLEQSYSRPFPGFTLQVAPQIGDMTNCAYAAKVFADEASKGVDDQYQLGAMTDQCTVKMKATLKGLGKKTAPDVLGFRQTFSDVLDYDTDGGINFADDPLSGGTEVFYLSGDLGFRVIQDSMADTTVITGHCIRQ